MKLVLTLEPEAILWRLTKTARTYKKLEFTRRIIKNLLLIYLIPESQSLWKATELVCNMMNLRFGLHVPYYRFLQLLPGCNLSYSTLIGWAGRAFEILAPLKPLLAREINKEAKLVCMDETTFKLLDTPVRIAAFKACFKGKEDLTIEGRKKKIRKRSIRLLKSLKKYMEKKIVEYAPREAVRTAIQYCLNNWQAPSQYPQHKNRR